MESERYWLRLLHGIKAVSTQLPRDTTPVQVYVDLWVVKYGQDWVDISEEMLIDKDSALGRMTRKLALENMLDQHYLTETMTYRAKIKQGV